MTIPSITLNTGAPMPQLGLGTWTLDDEGAAAAIEAAAVAGYRHFDTARMYENEAGVGEGIRRTGIPREELYITTKVGGESQGDDKAIASLDEALDKMKLDYVDLLLIHWPMPDRGLYVSTWKTFEKLQASGRVKAIGVSNFRVEHLEKLAQETDIVPAVNQIQLNPYITRPAQTAYGKEHGIVTQSWTPLGGGKGVAELLAEAPVVAAAERTGRTPGQVVLRWHVQQGYVVIPRSTSPQRLRDNLEIFDFELSEEDMAGIATLSKGPDAGVDSNVFGH